MLKITANVGEGTPVLRLEGTVDMYSSEDLKVRLAALEKDAASRIVLDLGGVDFIDSSGLAVLVGTQRRLRRSDGRLHLAAPTGRVRDVLDLMQLATFFDLHDSVEEALRA